MTLCFDIGGSTIKAGMARANAGLDMLGRIDTPRDDFAAFANAIAAFLPAAPSPSAPIAISITGVIDPANGIIKCANIPCIDGRPLADLLEHRLGRPVLIANDADCFALAEATAGTGVGHHIVFGAILGTGVGGGLVVGRRLVTGAGGYAGEWGHGPIAATIAGNPPVAIPRLPCGCGQVGCVDTVGGARGLERLDRLLNQTDRSSRNIIAAWESGDASATRTVSVQIDLLSGPLALVANITGADIVPVGGGLANSRRFIAELDTAVRSKMLRTTPPGFLANATSGNEPGLLGAAALAQNGGFA